MLKIRQSFAPITFIFSLTIVSTGLAQVRGTPRLVPVPPAGDFSATPPDVLPEPAAPPMARPKPKPDGRITLALRDGSRLVGRLKGLSNIKFKARFGEVSIAVKSIAGIRFPSDDKLPGPAHDQVTLVFSNGDVLTGQMQVKSIELESVWGKSTVALQHVGSIITSVDKKVWVNDGRWRLVPVSEVGTNPWNSKPAGYRTHGGVIGASTEDTAPTTIIRGTPSGPGTPYSPGPY